MVVNGKILVPLQLILDEFEAITKVDQENNSIEIDIQNDKITMYLGSTDVLYNGKKETLEVSPRQSNDTIMVPLGFIADKLGVNVSLGFSEIQNLDSKETNTDHESPNNERIVYIGGPRSQIFLDVKEYTGYRSTLLTNPDRLVVDILGYEGEPLEETIIDGAIVKSVESTLLDANTLRVFFYFNISTGYEIKNLPEGGLTVDFNYLIDTVGFERINNKPIIWFNASDKPEITEIELVDPQRLVLDLHDSTLLGQAREYEVSDSVVRRLRISQLNSATTRIVLELNSPMVSLHYGFANERLEMVMFEGTSEMAQEYLAKLEMQKQESETIPQDFEVDEYIVSEGTILTDIESEISLLKGRIICIDPGHGGSDPGSIGLQGTYEKDVVLSISLLLGNLLEGAGAKVVYTRDDDSYISIFERPMVAMRHDSEILISIHANGYVGGLVSGTETLYHPKDTLNLILAEAIQTHLIDAIQLPNRGLIQRPDLALLRVSEIPTVLVEVAFITHPKEEQLLKAEGFQLMVAEGIFRGILEFFEILASER